MYDELVYCEQKVNTNVIELPILRINSQLESLYARLCHGELGEKVAQEAKPSKGFPGPMSFEQITVWAPCIEPGVKGVKSKQD